jgi:hypothetical protein
MTMYTRLARGMGNTGWTVRPRWEPIQDTMDREVVEDKTLQPHFGTTLL